MSSPLRRVAVFCASADGVDPDLGAAAYDVGAGLAGRGIGLVYGGGGKGLMGRLSQGALDGGGHDAWPFTRPFYIILNLAIGGGWGGAQGVDETIWPQRYEIDYVRVYRN